MSDYGSSNSFSTNGRGSFGTREFLESNSLVAKFAFLLLVIFAFIILLRAGISLISYLLQPNQSPQLINGMVDATQMVVFPQDPSSNGAVTIYRSVNATDGVEFTWSLWIFINTLQSSAGTYQHVFSKGNSTIGENGMITPNNAPGVYLFPDTNNLLVVMNTFSTINEEITVPDIPINKWFNLIIRCQNTTLDIYVNGTITRSIELSGVPKQNYGDVYVAMNGGFNGYVSNLWYYNYALGTLAIQNLVASGPNTSMIGSNGMSDKNANYLSLRWYFAGSDNLYNP
jgi:hypothetical protein